MKRIFCFALVVCLLLTSCTFHDVYYDMAICGYYAVPDIAQADLKGSYQCQEIETDSYGRKLLEASFESVITLEPLTVLVIMQKYDSEYIYYYEDIAYSRHSFNSTDIESFKEQNDWDEPLDEAKLSRRRNSFTFDLVITFFPEHHDAEVWQACEAALDGEIMPRNDFYPVIPYIDGDGAGHDLYYFRIGREGGMEDYFVIVNEELELAFLQITDETFDPEAFVAFKQENGWQYGYTQ